MTVKESKRGIEQRMFEGKRVDGERERVRIVWGVEWGGVCVF